MKTGAHGAVWLEVVSRAAPQAAAPKATGRGCRAKPLPLMPLEAMQPIGKGEVKGNARRACPRSQSGKIGRGMQPEGLPKRSAE